MVLKAIPFDSTLEEDGSLKWTYGAKDVQYMFSALFSDGLVPSKSFTNNGSVEVLSGMDISVKNFYVIIDGLTCQSDTDETLTLAQGQALPRIDTVIIQVNSQAQEIKLDILKGEISNNPTPATLTQVEGGVYQYPLAYINVPALASSIQPSNIQVNKDMTGAKLYSDTIIGEPKQFARELVNSELLGWALAGSNVGGVSARVLFPILNNAYNNSSIYGSGTIYKDIEGLKRCTANVQGKGWLIAPFNSANLNILNTLWNEGNEANVWLLDTANQSFYCPRTRNWTANTSGVNANINESLPNFNASGIMGSDIGNTIISGAASKEGIIVTYAGGNSTTYKLKLDPSTTSLAYKNNAKVQQNASTVYIYYKIFDSVKYNQNITVESITQLLNEINSFRTDKLEKDMSNLGDVAPTSKETIVDWGMPDKTRTINLSIGSGGTYTPPSNGILAISATASNSYSFVQISSSFIKASVPAGAQSDPNLGASVPAVKGEVYTFAYAGNSILIRFTPLKGAI